MDNIKKLSPLSILLADDDTDDRYLFSKALNELSVNANLDSVGNGEELMDFLSLHADNLPHVLFLDLSMPRKNGFECLSEIKENIKYKDMAVIMFTTSYSRDIVYEQGIVKLLKDMGALDYIRKPNDFEQLKVVIRAALLMINDNKG